MTKPIKSVLYTVKNNSYNIKGQLTSKQISKKKKVITDRCGLQEESLNSSITNKLQLFVLQKLRNLFIINIFQKLLNLIKSLNHQQYKNRQRRRYGEIVYLPNHNSLIFVLFFFFFEKNLLYFCDLYCTIHFVLVVIFFFSILFYYYYF